MEDIKVKKEKEFSQWRLIVTLISNKKKKSLKGQSQWEMFKSDLLNLPIAIMSSKLTPQSFYLKSVTCYFYHFQYEKSQMSSGLNCTKYFAEVNSPCPTVLPNIGSDSRDMHKQV